MVNKKLKNEWHKEWVRKNPERRKAITAKYRATHKEQRHKYYLLNKEHINAKSKLWAESNRDKVRKSISDYAKKRPEKRAFREKMRYARKMRAVPKWINEFFISEAYDLAKLRTAILGFEWNVDHIVPLQSKIVCGLHVENNLQVIPANQNIVKGNRYWPDMPRTGI